MNKNKNTFFDGMSPSSLVKFQSLKVKCAVSHTHDRLIKMSAQKFMWSNKYSDHPAIRPQYFRWLKQYYGM